MKKGFIDPVTLLTLSLLTAAIVGTLVAGQALRHNTEDRSQAAVAEPCHVCRNNLCVSVAEYPDCTPNLDQCVPGRSCGTPPPDPTAPPYVPRPTKTPTPKPPSPTPTKTITTYDCSSTYECVAVPGIFGEYSNLTTCRADCLAPVPTRTPTPIPPTPKPTLACQGLCLPLGEDCPVKGNGYCSGDRFCCALLPTDTPITPYPTPPTSSCESEGGILCSKSGGVTCKGGGEISRYSTPTHYCCSSGCQSPPPTYTPRPTATPTLLACKREGQYCGTGTTTACCQGLTCTGDTCVASTSLLPLGSTCLAGTQCVSRLCYQTRCVSVIPTMTPTPTPYPTGYLKADYISCSNNRQCQSGNCEAAPGGYFCLPTGQSLIPTPSPTIPSISDYEEQARYQQEYGLATTAYELYGADMCQKYPTSKECEQYLAYEVSLAQTSGIALAGMGGIIAAPVVAPIIANAALYGYSYAQAAITTTPLLATGLNLLSTYGPVAGAALDTGSALYYSSRCQQGDLTACTTYQDIAIGNMAGFTLAAWNSAPITAENGSFAQKSQILAGDIKEYTQAYYYHQLTGWCADHPSQCSEELANFAVNYTLPQQTALGQNLTNIKQSLANTAYEIRGLSEQEINQALISAANNPLYEATALNKLTARYGGSNNTTLANYLRVNGLDNEGVYEAANVYFPTKWESTWGGDNLRTSRLTSIDINEVPEDLTTYERYYVLASREVTYNNETPEEAIKSIFNITWNERMALRESGEYSVAGAMNLAPGTTIADSCWTGNINCMQEAVLEKTLLEDMGFSANIRVGFNPNLAPSTLPYSGLHAIVQTQDAIIGYGGAIVKNRRALERYASKFNWGNYPSLLWPFPD